MINKVGTIMNFRVCARVGIRVCSKVLTIWFLGCAARWELG